MEVRVLNTDAVIKKFERACKLANCDYTFNRTETVKECGFFGAIQVFNIYDVSEPKVDEARSDFRVIKRFDHVENIVKTVTGEDSESNNEYLAKCWCDDCQRNIRTRRFSYLLERIDGTKMQVGSACLQKYADKKLIDNFFDAVDSYRYEFDDEEYGSNISSPHWYNLDHALEIIIKAFRNFGSYSEFRGKYGLAQFEYDCRTYENSDKFVIEDMKKLKEYILKMDPENEWCRNIIQIVKNGYFSVTNFNFVRSMVTLLKKLDETDKYTVELDEGKQEITVTKIIKVVEYDHYTKIHVITDENAYVVMTARFDEELSKMLNEGITPRVALTIKGNSEFNGQMYNFGNRAKIVSE